MMEKEKDNEKKPKLMDDIKGLMALKGKVTKKKVSSLFVYKKYIKKAKDTEKYKKKMTKFYDKKGAVKSFDIKKLWYVLIAICIVVCAVYIVNVIKNDHEERERLHVVSEKEYERYSDKEKILIASQDKLNVKSDNNLILKNDNLNTAFIYESVQDEEDKKYAASNHVNPEPSFLNEERDVINLIDESVAGQVYKKLKLKSDLFVASLLDMANENPVSIVRRYGYSGYKILGNYNPKNSTHIKNRPVTYFIDHFSNVNIDFRDADGEKMDNYKNIQDIMSMASVYTYYHNPYDTKTYMNYCYDLYDRSYTYVASISNVYYCSGCMDYSDPDIDDRTVTLSHIPSELYEQRQEDDMYEQKAGTLEKMDLTKITINDYTYEKYVSDIKKSGHNRLHNYCPGHIDLDITVTYRCLDNKNGLLDIDNYGNSGRNYIETWHGWEKQKINTALSLANKDWELEYGLIVDSTDYLKPLPQELINYYMCTLPDDVSKDRKTLIETALKSVSKIPYYYGGKPHSYGYVSNSFNTRVRPDYNNRALAGLDCSGWISWVYWTAFSKKIIKNEGTAGLAKEGTRIVRTELKPGDIILRPGYDSHVMMFLSFEEGGKVKVIHENGSVNNISIATYEAYYPYYRKIFAN